MSKPRMLRITDVFGADLAVAVYWDGSARFEIGTGTVALSPGEARSIRKALGGAVAPLETKVITDDWDETLTVRHFYDKSAVFDIDGVQVALTIPQAKRVRKHLKGDQ